MAPDGPLQMSHLLAEASQLYKDILEEILAGHELRPKPSKTHEAEAVTVHCQLSGSAFSLAGGLPP